MDSGEHIPIFVSMGRLFKPEHQVFAERINSALNARRLEPRTLPREQWNRTNPLKAIQSVMSQSHGVIVVAFPRIRVEVGYEWPNSPMQSLIEDRNMSTIWLQIEACMAYALNLPLLMLVEEHLYPQGIMDPKYRDMHTVTYSMGAAINGQNLPAPVSLALSDFADQAKYHAKHS